MKLELTTKEAALIESALRVACDVWRADERAMDEIKNTRLALQFCEQAKQAEMLVERLGL